MRAPRDDVEGAAGFGVVAQRKERRGEIVRGKRPRPSDRVIACATGRVEVAREHVGFAPSGRARMREQKIGVQIVGVGGDRALCKRQRVVRAAFAKRNVAEKEQKS
eukprot:Amastigsp_a339636_25.p3 type:complete len:106 gc:universal Amastigsp_a339636_25:611-294(-)